MREYRCMRVTDKILICTKKRKFPFPQNEEMGIAVYCVNVTKKSVEKRVSMLTHRELSIAKNKIKNSNHLNII